MTPRHQSCRYLLSQQFEDPKNFHGYHHHHWFMGWQGARMENHPPQIFECLFHLRSPIVQNTLGNKGHLSHCEWCAWTHKLWAESEAYSAHSPSSCRVVCTMHSNYMSENAADPVWIANGWKTHIWAWLLSDTDGLQFDSTLKSITQIPVAERPWRIWLCIFHYTFTCAHNANSTVSSI